MGRPSILTEPMREEILKRMALGEPVRKIARDLGIGEATLRRNFSAQAPQVKELAMTRAKVELETSRLPVSAQRAVMSLTEQFKGIQEDYTTAAARSTKTAVKVANLAGKIADGIQEDSFTPDDVAKLAAVDVLSKTVNQALQPASNLIAANKGKGEDKDRTLEDLLEEANQLRRQA